MNGHMAEAQEGLATLQDVDEGTFIRFIQWAHKGFYTAAEKTIVEIASPRTSSGQKNEEVVTTPQEPSQGHFDIAILPQDEYDYAVEPPETRVEPVFVPSWSKSVPSYQKGKKSKIAVDWEFPTQQSGIDTAQEKKRALKEAFISRRYTVRQSALQIPPPRPNQGPKEDYTDVFLAHARLYVFADKYDIEPLKVLSLEELHATLAIYTLHPARTRDIIALLRYVYSNTLESRQGGEDMRSLVTQYVGYEMDTLIDDEEFKNLMIEDGGPLLGDFMTMVRRRIS